MNMPAKINDTEKRKSDRIGIRVLPMTKRATKLLVNDTDFKSVSELLEWLIKIKTKLHLGKLGLQEKYELQSKYKITDKFLEEI